MTLIFTGTATLFSITLDKGVVFLKVILFLLNFKKGVSLFTVQFHHRVLHLHWGPEVLEERTFFVVLEIWVWLCVKTSEIPKYLCNTFVRHLELKLKVCTYKVWYMHCCNQTIMFDVG